MLESGVDRVVSVSYTHLDVYKRQMYNRVISVLTLWFIGASKIFIFQRRPLTVANCVM